MKLIIFDLDQTLVELIGVHDEATRLLFREYFDVEARLSDIDFAGRSLDANFEELARASRVPAEDFDRNRASLLNSYEDIFSRILPRDASRYILPGARELLESLDQTDNLLALYTGDSPRIVGEVFRATSLGKYFRFCVYGTGLPSRAEMIARAVEQARRLTGNTFRGKDIVVIGDSVRDIEAARPFNALTIAVATGIYPAAELARHHPDHVFDSLRDFHAVLEAIGVPQKARVEGGDR